MTDPKYTTSDPEPVSKEVAKWADDFMFEAEEIAPNAEIEVFLLSCNNDPLGSIAAAAKAYKGEFVSSLSEITDEERRYYLEQIQKTALAMPLEAVNFHFRLKGVTRGFTHQMVRQRTAAYSQESTRFAVKTGVPVGLPPSLQGVADELDIIKKDIRARYPEWLDMSKEKLGLEGWQRHNVAQEEWDFRSSRVSQQEGWLAVWNATVRHIEKSYNYLVNAGMPAEDARGLLPTNLLTQLNYITNLRNLQAEAGKRLCTQAQFEWRIVWAKFIEAIRNYGRNQTYSHTLDNGEIGEGGYDFDAKPGDVSVDNSAWQFEELAKLFMPVCYYKGSCQFNADFDRKCSIKNRVNANADLNRPSTEWGEEYENKDELDRVVGGFNGTQVVRSADLGMPIFIPAIHPAEWLLDPAAAR